MHAYFFQGIYEHISTFYKLEYALSGAFDELIVELEVNEERCGTVAGVLHYM